jgi:hypothetical protein
VIWAILILLGVPLWLCAVGVCAVILGNRNLRKRPGNIPVRVLRPGKKRWTRGNAIWVSDVFAWRASPASWNEDVFQVTDASLHEPVDSQTMKKLHRLGENPAVASFALNGGALIDVAARADHRSALVGPFARQPQAVGAPAVEHGSK